MELNVYKHYQEIVDNAENLLRAVLKVGEDVELKDAGVDFNDDIITGVYAALASIEPRKQTAIKLRYFEHKTLDAISEYFGLSVERCRQIINEALRDLRQPRQKSLITYGFNGCFENINNISNQEYIKSFNDGFTQGYERAINNVRKQEKYIKSEIKNIDRDDVYSTTIIEDLDLSVRSYNCLKRAGFNTVMNLTNIEEDKILKIRNLGLKCCKEIATKLKDLGITGTAWENYL